jgi:hypothetical protein
MPHFEKTYVQLLVAFLTILPFKNLQCCSRQKLKSEKEHYFAVFICLVFLKSGL